MTSDDRELSFGRTQQADLGWRRRMASSWTIALVVHLVALMVVIGLQRSRIIQVGVSSDRDQGIGAFVVPGAPPAAAPRPTPVQRPRPAVQPTETARATQDMPADASLSAEGTSGQGSGAATGGGPVRLTQGVDIQLLRRVVPEYPPVMRAAGLRGVVVLDAVINRDGTIGEIKVLESSGPAFTQAAVEAVKQWQYTPIPYEGILTVTLNFTLTR
jgi:TonB family protein